MSYIEMLMSPDKFFANFIEYVNQDYPLGLGNQEVLNMYCLTLSSINSRLKPSRKRYSLVLR